MAVVAKQKTITSAPQNSSLAGTIPTKKLTKEQLFKTHEGHIKKQNATQIPNGPRAVKQPNLAEAYPASTKSIRDLEIIPLSELSVETHHRGKGLIVKVVSPPYIGAGAVSIVEDQWGNVDKVAIYNQGDSAILSGVPEGCIVAVKEPYYVQNGAENDFMICVDHPSDVILLRFTDSIIPEPLRLGPLLKSAAEWRTAGDQAFLERDFPTAVFCYTEALEGLEDDSAKAPVYTKRAGVNLLLGRYDAAKFDALASRTGATTDWKAYYNAGRAAYGLCEYATSKSYFEEALKLNAKGAAGVQKEYERVLARVKEEEEGAYDFAAMHASLSPTSVHIDAGSFLRNTRVADSGFHGRGLFATRPLKAGDLVYVEKATLMPNQYDPARASAALYTLMVRQLCDNPSLADTVLKLFPGSDLSEKYERTGLEGTIVDGVPIVDVFLIEGIRTKNCFSAPLSTYDDTKPTYNSARCMAKGLWAHSSLMNHSCVPNTMRSFVGDMLICRATRDVQEDQELFQQYVPVKTLVDVRNREFEEGWGFECRCGLCDGERKSDGDKLKKRKDAMLSLEKFLDKKPSNNGKGGTIVFPDATIRTVDRMMRQLEELHETEVYEALPRLTLVYPCNWLVDAHRAKRQWGKVVKYSLKVLRNFAFNAVPRDEDPAKLTVDWDPREIYTRSGEVSLMAVHVVASLERLAEAYAALGHKELAERCVEAARFGYTMVTGFSEDVDALGQ
ncbi:hypothetical protein N0V85_006522 [Neurospora sp. IMI 360204]|nr:hypothetical protein N0V85_006522 [Neurospora sp. IMI 360204]